MCHMWPQDQQLRSSGAQQCTHRSQAVGVARGGQNDLRKVGRGRKGGREKGMEGEREREREGEKQIYMYMDMFFWLHVYTKDHLLLLLILQEEDIRYTSIPLLLSLCTYCMHV